MNEEVRLRTQDLAVNEVRSQGSVVEKTRSGGHFIPSGRKP